jgi:hypothetical protein
VPCICAYAAFWARRPGAGQHELEEEEAETAHEQERREQDQPEVPVGLLGHPEGGRHLLAAVHLGRVEVGHAGAF